MSTLLGKKIGMTQIFSEDGVRITVTVIEAGPCPVLGVKEKSIQIGFGEVKESKLNKPIQGFFKKNKLSARRIIKEVGKDASSEYKPGDELKVDLFQPGDFVDITGTSIGKGFAGGMKRWNWKGGPGGHGSMSHRRIGSTGSSAAPSRVFRGRHQAGHMGARTVTVQNLKVVEIDAKNSLLLVEGAVPGHRNAHLLIKTAKKRKSLAKPKEQTNSEETKAQKKPEAVKGQKPSNKGK